MAARVCELGFHIKLGSAMEDDIQLMDYSKDTLSEDQVFITFNVSTLVEKILRSKGGKVEGSCEVTSNYSFGE